MMNNFKSYKEKLIKTYQDLNNIDLNQILEKLKNTDLSDIKNLTENSFSEILSGRNFPEPDIIIRTGGQKRLSNFLLWESAYSELYFLDIFWPEFSEENLQEIIEDFSKRKRNFGGT